jgi:hypothetical protein
MDTNTAQVRFEGARNHRTVLYFLTRTIHMQHFCCRLHRENLPRSF